MKSLLSAKLITKETNDKYNKSIQSFTLIQIRIITILTGILYIVYSQIDQYILPLNIMNIASSIHLYLIAPILFFISILTFFSKYYKPMIYILILAPIFAALVNLFLVRNLDSFTIYMTEIYLIIFWTFTISGLKVKQSSLSVFLLSIIVFINYYLIFPLPKELLIMHSFWMVSTISFGLVGAFLLDRLSKINFINYENLGNLAVTDNLTGLYNRTKLDEILQSELDRSKRFNHTFSLMIIDIDYFKVVNDTYGHQTGDAFLIEITSLLNNNSRSTDILFRWGGEEFIMLCPEADEKNILKYAETLRQKIELHEFKTIGNKTVSIGITLLKNDDNIDSLVKRADEALYIAKNNGRNQIVFAQA
jgi:diguanylate cyclase (GGDEF)-like protein